MSEYRVFSEPGRRVLQHTPAIATRRWSELALCFLLAFAGCAPTNIDDTYGKRRGTTAGPSVNGTAVLSGMFESAGHRVRTWRRLSPILEEYTTIVWFPDDFQPPTLEQRQFLEDWLSNESDRTVVYVGRDFNAAPMYWTRVQPEAPADQKMEVMRRAATARAEHDFARARMPESEHADWFTLQRDKPRRSVESLEGLWSEGVDGSKVEIELDTRLAIPSESENDDWYGREDNDWEGRPKFTPLLESEGDVIAIRLQMTDWGDSQLIVVANGSFLLNLPLIQHEHRKLAAKLVSECSPGKVIFLESGPGGPMIFDEEPGAAIPTGFQVFTVWPLGFIIMHLAVLGMLCCLAIYPIFGRARGVSPSSIIVPGDATAAGSPVTVIRADFGKHIDALGELLENTADGQYARNRVMYYHEHVKRDSGTK